MRSQADDIVELRDDFYRDSYSKVIFVLLSVLVSLGFLIAISVYFYMAKPKPIVFFVENDMRILRDVPVGQPYLSEADLLQWVAITLPKAFELDFNHYNDQLKTIQQSFTSNGWNAFLNQLNMYANYNNVQAYKLFITASPGAAPYILRQGIIPDSGKYGWWVEMPININYEGYKPLNNVNITLQVLVVRVPTLNNLNGVAIDNVMQPPPPASKNQPAANNG